MNSMTNYEKLRKMTTEEMSNFLNEITYFCRYEYDDCKECPMYNHMINETCTTQTIKNWLEQKTN